MMVKKEKQYLKEVAAGFPHHQRPRSNNQCPHGGLQRHQQHAEFWNRGHLGRTPGDSYPGSRLRWDNEPGIQVQRSQDFAKSFATIVVQPCNLSKSAWGCPNGEPHVVLFETGVPFVYHWFP